MENDEIDLRPYIGAILRRWRLVVTLLFVGAIVAASISLALPKRYTATASTIVFIRQTGSQVGLNQQYLTIETIDIGARRQGLAALAKSDTIETKLPPDVVSQFTEGQYTPGKLTDLIKVTTDGDLMQIAATARTPQYAKAVADAWARTYVTYVQSLYQDGYTRVQLASDAIQPYKPSSPNVLRNTAFGAFVGLLAGILLALAWHVRRSPAQLDRRVENTSATRSPSPSR